MKSVLKIILIFHVILTIVSIIVGLYLFVIHPKQSFQQALDDAPYDAIIVPGLPFDGERWSDLMEARVKWSKQLYESGVTRNVIYSGSAVYTSYYESRIMKMYGAELGIPADHIFAETEAEHSTENLVYSYRLAKMLGFERIALATDPIQSAMLGLYEDDLETTVDRIPIWFSKLEQMDYPMEIEIQPELARADTFVSLPERETRWERFQGTLGKRIKSK